MARSVLVEGYTSAGRKVVDSGLVNNGYQPATGAKPASAPPPPKGGSAISQPTKDN